MSIRVYHERRCSSVGLKDGASRQGGLVGRTIRNCAGRLPTDAKKDGIESAPLTIND